MRQIASIPYFEVRYSETGERIAMPTATVTSKGQITIPVEVREALHLKAGDKVDFYETEPGQFALQPKTGSIMDLKGILQRFGYVPTGTPPTIEEMDQGIHDQAAELDFETLSSEAKLQTRRSNRSRRTA
jgi:antitoxin PrlF